MNIAFIHPSWPGDEGTGATHTATQVVTGLATAGHDVSVFCLEEFPPAANTDALYSLRQLPQSDILHTYTGYNRAIRAAVDDLGRADIVHSYVPATAPALAAVGDRTGAATVLTLNAYAGVCAKNDLLYLGRDHCDDNSTLRCLRCLAQTSPGHDEYSTPYRLASRLGNLRLVRQAAESVDDIDAFRAPSAHVKDNYVGLGYPAAAVHVIPHPVDETFVVPHESDFEEPYNLLYVGSLSKHKGVDKLVPLLAALRDDPEEFTLTIVGTGGLASDIESQIAEYGLSDLVDLSGFVPNDELPSVYATHDCFVYPGIWEEPLARIYLESLASGTPIVTSSYGSIADIVGDAGRLTDGSVEGFRTALLDMVRNERLTHMSTAAQARAKEFSLETVVTDIESLYASLVTGR